MVRIVPYVWRPFHHVACDDRRVVLGAKSSLVAKSSNDTPGIGAINKSYETEIRFSASETHSTPQQQTGRDGRQCPMEQQRVRDM